MDDPDFFRAYPAAQWPDGAWASVPVKRISRTAMLAPLIERNTVVRFRFGDEVGYQLETISYVVSGSYGRAEAAFERRLGQPIAGDRTQARCLEPDGSHKIEDPSGVGHVIASCLAGATIVDRRHGNVVYLASVYDWELKEYGSKSVDYSAQLVTIEPLRFCEDCKQTK